MAVFFAVDRRALLGRMEADPFAARARIEAIDQPELRARIGIEDDRHREPHKPAMRLRRAATGRDDLGLLALTAPLKVRMMKKGLLIIVVDRHMEVRRDHRREHERHEEEIAILLPNMDEGRDDGHKGDDGVREAVDRPTVGAVGPASAGEDAVGAIQDRRGPEREAAKDHRLPAPNQESDARHKPDDHREERHLIRTYPCRRDSAREEISERPMHEAVDGIFNLGRLLKLPQRWKFSRAMVHQLVYADGARGIPNGARTY